MAFCTSCGAQLTGPFCVNCGQRGQAPSAPRPQPTAQPAAPAAQPVTQRAPQAAAAAPAKSGFAKALLIIGGIVLVIFVMGLAATFYGMYWVKHKVASYTGIGSTPNQVVVANGHSCTLLSREDLQQVLGITIERTAEIMEDSDPGCAYYTNPEGFAQLQKMTLEETRQESARGAQRPASENNSLVGLMSNTKDLEGAVKSIQLTQPDKDGGVFAFTIKRSMSPESWAPFRATIAAVPGFEEVQGVGDHAIFGTFGHAFYVLKGDSMVSLETMYVPDVHTRGVELGRRIIAHL